VLDFRKLHGKGRGMKRRKTFDERMNEGGFFYYLVAVLGGFGFYVFIWLFMILGIAAGF
jgi:hypothetical protein